MKHRKFAAWFWYALLWCPCYAISRVWFNYRFCGKSNVPQEGPVLLVSNHQSNLDPVLVGIACPRQLKYLARVGLFFWPFSLWIRSLGAVPIDREKGALSGIRTTLQLLKDGEAVLVFPEGSRTPDGKLHELLSGFCLLARRSKATIVPCGIEGAFDALPRGSAFPWLAPIRLEFENPISPKEVAQMSDQELVNAVRRRIEHALRINAASSPPIIAKAYDLHNGAESSTARAQATTV